MSFQELTPTTTETPALAELLPSYEGVVPELTGDLAVSIEDLSQLMGELLTSGNWTDIAQSQAEPQQ